MAWAEFLETKKWVAKRVHPKTGEVQYGSWYAMGRHPITKKRISEPAGIESNLKEALAAIEQIELGKDKSRDGGAGITIKAAYDEYKTLIMGSRKAGTWPSYDWALVKLLDFLKNETRLESITKKDIQKFRLKIMEPYSVTLKSGKIKTKRHAKNGILDILKFSRTFFSYCVESGHIELNPAQGITRGISEDDIAVFLTDDQVRHVLDCIDNPNFVEIKKNHAGSKEEFGDIIRTVLLTGMRRGDICAFKAGHIVDGKIHIKGKGRGTGKPRVVGINMKLGPIIDKYISRGTEFIFRGWNTRRITSQWNRLYKRALGANPTMPKRCRFHDLRHTFASNYLRGGGTLADLQLILGHSNIKTTIRYVHLQDDDLLAKMENVKSGWLDAAAPQFNVA